MLMPFIVDGLGRTYRDIHLMPTTDMSNVPIKKISKMYRIKITYLANGAQEGKKLLAAGE